MGLRLSFFKTPKNRVFNYQPLYYDERKEDLQERIARAREETKSKDYVPGRNIRMNFRRNLYENKRRPGSPFILRLIVLLSMVGLMVALYYIARAFGLLFV
ncbi:hypothetical protein SDC9_104173 [bioreactor metagenome]|uniref:Uncharacterized protein n=1 Tax=bioreactor metagenome TaxID=1076179 RepID=A0A645AYG0_9ZZZZ|nr:hypothetical protein [Rikenellaceae bacterium]